MINEELQITTEEKDVQISDKEIQLPSLSETIENDSEGVEEEVSFQIEETISQDNQIIIDKLQELIDVTKKNNELLSLSNNDSLNYNTFYSESINFFISLIGVILLYFVGKLLYKLINNIFLGGL